MQTHRCFLYGKKFKIITNLAGLEWLITVKNHQCARLNRWVSKLSEYNFDIRHQPGSKHVNADVLSCHVAAFVRKCDASQEKGGDTGELPLSKESISQAQKEDENCKQIVKALMTGKELPYCLDQDSVLYCSALLGSEQVLSGSVPKLAFSSVFTSVIIAAPLS